jgi:hypothetical protein
VGIPWETLCGKESRCMLPETQVLTHRFGVDGHSSFSFDLGFVV